MALFEIDHGYQLLSLLTARKADSHMHPQQWAIQKCIDRGLSSSISGIDAEVKAYEDLLLSGRFIPDSTIFLSSDSEPTGYLNLSKFGPLAFSNNTTGSVEQLVVQACLRVNWDLLQQTVESAIRFLDTHTIDESSGSIQLISFGLAELLIRLGVNYGNNPVCNLIVDELFFYISFWSYKTSVALAEERGPYGACEPLTLASSPFIKRLQIGINSRGLGYDLVGAVSKFGIRNKSILPLSYSSQSSFFFGTSYSLGSFPLFSWTRTDALGATTMEMVDVAKDYIEQFGVDIDSSNYSLPSFFVAKAPESDFLDVFARAQFWSDRKVSSSEAPKPPEDPILEIERWTIPSPPIPAISTPVDTLTTVNPSEIAGSIQGVQIQSWKTSSEESGTRLLLEVSIQFTPQQLLSKEPLNKSSVTIPAVIPPSYDYAVLRSTIPAPITKK